LAHVALRSDAHAMVEQVLAPPDASATDGSDYHNMRVPQIRRLCDLRGLPLQGLKSELVAQLRDYDLRQHNGLEAYVADTGVATKDKPAVAAVPPSAAAPQGVTQPTPFTAPIPASVTTPLAAPLTAPPTVRSAAPLAGTPSTAPSIPSTVVQPQALEPVPKSAFNMEVPANHAKKPTEASCAWEMSRRAYCG